MIVMTGQGNNEHDCWTPTTDCYRRKQPFCDYEYFLNSHWNLLSTDSTLTESLTCAESRRIVSGGSILLFHRGCRPRGSEGTIENSSFGIGVVFGPTVRFPGSTSSKGWHRDRRHALLPGPKSFATQVHVVISLYT